MILGIERLFFIFLLGNVYAWVLNGFTGIEIDEKTIPNQGIKLSLQNIKFFCGIIFVFFWPINLLYWPFMSKFVFLPKFIGITLVALIESLYLGFLKSGRPAIQHFVIRLMLTCNGQAP